MEKIKIILVDDHQIVRDGIKSLLAGAKEIDIIGEASEGNELLNLLKTKKPDVLVMDISMPGMSGIELTKAVKEQFPKIEVLILSMYTQEDFVLNAVSAGAKGYLPKNTTRNELINAIASLHKGKQYFNEAISSILLSSYVNTVQKKTNTEETETPTLSAREIEILKLYVEGASNQEIADKLFISIRTVESHKNHMMQKLNIKSIVELVKYAIRNKIVEI